MARVRLIALIPLFVRALATPAYSNANLTDTTVMVSSFDQLHAEAGKFDQAVEGKYGGYVVEVDGEVKVATTDEMTQQISAQLAGLDTRDVDPQFTDLNKLDKRTCSFPGCFTSSICRSYTDCHVCIRATPVKRGWCI